MELGAFTLEIYMYQYYVLFQANCDNVLIIVVVIFYMFKLRYFKFLFFGYFYI